MRILVEVIYTNDWSKAKHWFYATIPQWLWWVIQRYED